MVNYWDEVSKKDVEKAIEIYNNDPQKYSKNQARSTFLVYEGKKYPAKAIRRIAYEVHFKHPPEEHGFYGGNQTKIFFEKLGFIINKTNDEENINKTKDKKIKDNFLWISFYEEFANRLKHHENNPNLLNIFKNIIKEVNEDLPKSSRLNELNVDAIDPFIIYGLFNRDISNDKRYNILEKIKNTFKIQSELPNHFEGIPTLMTLSLTPYLNHVTDDSTKIVWTLFKLAIEYSEGKNVKTEFTSAYNEMLKLDGIKWNLTIFLYWIRPYTFINLDSINRDFMKNNPYINKSIASLFESLKDKVPSGEDYIKLCQECEKKILKSSIYKIETFPQLSEVAWNDVNFNYNPKRKFYEYLNYKNYVFKKELLENYLLSLKVKPFVILTGNSGTGKTKIAQLFAQYLQEKLDYENNYELVAVGANWTDNKNIVGYYNVITKEYQTTPICNLIERANDEYNQDKPYFLILDEMNLSYVERYFADFLSALESNEKINKPGTDKFFSIPANLFVIGTVNVDETTYMFSPKVLDRANVLEFKTLPVTDYMECNIKNIVDINANIDYIENPLKHYSFKKVESEKDQLDINYLRKKYDEEKWGELKTHLNQLQTLLKESGFDFGFRVTNEILSFILEARYYENNDNYEWKRYLDAQILQKLLPKLHGSRNVIGDTLQELEKYCKDEKFGMSYKKLHEMNEELETIRYVSFIK